MNNMTERLRSGSCTNSANISAKMANDLTPRKTMLILVIVVGCFAVLWPKVFYPMLVGSANQHIKPSPIDKTTGCCDVISETDVNTIKIMSELCRTIIKRDEDTPLTGREIVAKCQSAVLETCGIDISAVLQEQVRLGQSFKQILEEVRSLNGSLCLKYNFGLAPWRLGVPHRVTVKVSPSSIKQERPLQLRSELVHPAFRERGRAIPQPQTVTPSRPTPRIIEGRPGPIPAMRPTLGGAGHVVPPPKQGTGSMGLIMPIYTVGIVIFFTYTVMKIVFKKQPEALYPPVEPDPNFRKEVFESERTQVGPKLTREGVSSKLVVNAMSALLDEVDQEIESRRKASEVAEQDVVANGNIVKSQEEEQPTVKVLGMEMTASCEGGKKWSRPDSPVLPSASPPSQEPVEPPQEIFLEGTLPAQSHLLVADAATEAQKPSSEEDPAIVLAGKMTLSVISLDSSENGTDESSNSGGRKQEERSSSNISEEFEKIEADINLQDQIDDIIGEAQNISTEVQKSEEFDLLQEIENDIKEITSKNIIAQLEHLGESIEIQNVEDQIIVQHLDNYLPISEIGREFLEKETFETVQQQLEKEIDENITESLAEEQLPEIQQVKAEENDVVESGIKEQENVKEIIQDEITAELTTDKIEEHAIENKISQQEVTRLEEEIKPAQKSLGDIIDESPVDISQEKEQVAVVEKEVAANEINAETEAQEKIQTITLEKEAAAEKQPENVISDHAVQNLAPTEDEIGNNEIAQLESKTYVVNHSEITSPGSAVQSNIIEEKKLIGEPQSEKVELPVSEELIKLAEKEIVSEGKSSEILPGEQSSNIKQEPVVAQVAEDIKKVEENESTEEKIQQIESVQNIPAEEQETFNKLNEAISDLSSEFRRTEEDKPVERLVVNDESPIDLEDEEEEIEYEYEVSDDEAVGVDIGNVDRIGELADEESVNRLNGDDQEQSKYVTTSSATLAENDISDEDLESEDEDVEVEEIIEYVTDDEEEVDEVVQPGERNNVNHVNDRSNAHE